VSARTFALAAALALTASSARAASPPNVTLVFDACPQIDEARLRSLVGIELATITTAGSAYEARLSCVGANIAIDVRREAEREAFATFTVNGGEGADTTALRVLALAITEQIALDAPTPAEPTPPPRTLAPQAPPTTVTTPAPASPPDLWRVLARGSARRVGRPSAWLAGAGLGLERALRPHLGLALDFDVASGDAAASAASVAVRDLRATVGLALGADAGRWSLRAIPGFAVGRAHLEASPRDASATGASLDATWAGPSLALRASFALADGLFLLADASGGLTTRRVTGLVDGASPLFELRGPWLALGLGAGATF
jgi:hypothetical protein